jgi:4-diphosphocytidyl-2-C-methyl-D-erythritol kinase
LNAPTIVGAFFISTAMSLTRRSPCKVNLLLNILGRRSDGFHDLETLFLPVPLHDTLSFEVAGEGVHLTCNHPGLPVDSTNLVHRAATRFLAAGGIRQGVRIHLEKFIPMAAGLGGGSGNAAHTLLGLDELFGGVLPPEAIDSLAAELGSDVNFFLQDKPALAVGRGEQVTPLPAFDALKGRALLLHHPGFGISTAWAYQNLARFPKALNGRPGRAKELVAAMEAEPLSVALAGLYNSLEAPALEKYPVLRMFQEFLRARGAVGTLMSGSGSTTFAIFADLELAKAAIGPFEAEFGTAGWTEAVAL